MVSKHFGQRNTLRVISKWQWLKIWLRMLLGHLTMLVNFCFQCQIVIDIPYPSGLSGILHTTLILIFSTMSHQRNCQLHYQWHVNHPMFCSYHLVHPNLIICHRWLYTYIQMTFIPLVKYFLSSQWFVDVHNMVHFHILTCSFLTQCLFLGHLRTFQPVKDLLQDLTWQEMEGVIW